MKFIDIIKHAFSWLERDGYAFEVVSPSCARYTKGWLAILVSMTEELEIFVQLRKSGIDPIDLNAMRRYRGDIRSNVGNPGPDLFSVPTAYNDEQLREVTLEMSKQLHSFREEALNPNSMFLNQVARMMATEPQELRDEPEWIVASRVATVMAKVNDDASVVRILARHEPELNDYALSLLNNARSRLNEKT